MKNPIITICAAFIFLSGYSQTTNDFFNSKDVKISWLGIDFSHTKLIGDFSQFSGAGGKSPKQIRNTYFPGWNQLVLAEPAKYDIKGMIRRSNIYIDIDMIMAVNANTPLENISAYNNPDYSLEDIKGFVSTYDMKDKEGIGVLFINECLNKNNEEAYFHFVAIDMKTREILVHDRLRGEPGGIGLRNYWAGAIYDVINEINKNRYFAWKAEY